MSGSACMVSLWGESSHIYPVVKHLRMFQARNKQFCQDAQPLQVLAYEKALLMLGETSIDKEDTKLAKEALIQLAKVPCTKGKKRKITEEECLCDACLDTKLGYDDFHKSGAWEAQSEMENDMNLTYEQRGAHETLQKEFFEALLGKELAERAPLRFGALESLDQEDPFPVAFIYLKNKIEIYRDPLIVVDPGDNDPPTALEEWAFTKAMTLLGLHEERSLFLFPSRGTDPRNLVVFLAEARNIMHGSTR